jgi:anti-sigma factor RsiW
MRCKRFERQMWAYVEGQLPLSRVQALEAHLRACPHCQRQLEAAQATYHALRALPRRRAPVNLSEQVRRRIAEAPARPTLDWARVWRRVALAPALGLLAAAAWWGWYAYQSAPSPNTVAADSAESFVELHEQLELADWSPSPTPSYFISTGYTR